MLILKGSDILDVVTDAGANLECHATWIDYDSGTFTPDRTDTADITSATTTTVVAAPGGSVRRNVKFFSAYNSHATLPVTTTIRHNDGSNPETIWKGVLKPGEAVVINDGDIKVLGSNGRLSGDDLTKMYFQSTLSQAGFTSDTYVTNSFYIPPRTPKVGTKIRFRLNFRKTTGGGTATTIITLRAGTAGTTSDASIATFTFTAATAATDEGILDLELTFLTIGSGTSSTVRALCVCSHNLSAAGIMNVPMFAKGATSSGFDSTNTSLGIGFSINAGASSGLTMDFIAVEMENA